MSAKRKAAPAAAFTMASRVGAQVAQLWVFVVAANSLSPAAFGVFSLFFALKVLFAHVVQLGWPEFVASWDGAPEVDAQAFTFATLGGIVAAALGSYGAAVMLVFPSVAPYAALQLLLSLSLLGGGATAALEGQLLRTGRGTLLAMLMLGSEIAGSGAAVVGLTLGWGVTALGLGKLVTQLVLTVGSVAATRWFPGFRLRGPGTRAIVDYQKHLLVTKLTGYSQQYAATLALGFFLGPHAVGLYRAAERVVGAVTELVREPARVVCWMTLRRTADREPAERLGEALARETERFLTVLMLVATPVFLGVAAVSESVLVALIGAEWQAAAPVISLLCVAKLINVPAVVTLPLFSLRQQSGQVLRLSLVMGAATLLALPIFAPFGLVPAAVGQAVAAMAVAVAVGKALTNVAGVRWLRSVLLAFPSLIASVLMVLGLSAFQEVGAELASDVRLRLGLEIGLGALVFLLPFTVLGGWRRLATIQPAG